VRDQKQTNPNPRSDRFNNLNNSNSTDANVIHENNSEITTDKDPYEDYLNRPDKVWEREAYESYQNRPDKVWERESYQAYLNRPDKVWEREAYHDYLNRPDKKKERELYKEYKKRKANSTGGKNSNADKSANELKQLAEEITSTLKSSPKSAIEAYGLLKKQTPQVRKDFYSAYPHIIEQLEENLPADFLKSNQFGYDKGHEMNDETYATELAILQATNPEAYNLVKGNEHSNDEFKTSENTINNKTGLGYWNKTLRSLKGQNLKQLFSKEFTLSGLDLSTMQEASGGTIAGAEMGKFTKDAPPKENGSSQENKVPSDIKVKFKEKNRKENVQEAGKVEEIAKAYSDTNKDKKEENKYEANYEIIADNIPIESFNTQGADYSTRTGKINTGKVVFRFFGEKADENGLTEGFMHIEIESLKVDNLRYTTPITTYLVGALNVSNLSFSIHKRFLLPEANRFMFLLNLMTSHLPAVFSNLSSQILQIPQKMSSSDEAKEGEVKEDPTKGVLEGLMNEVSTYVHMNINWDSLSISNFISMGKKIEVIKEITTGKAEINTNSVNKDEKLQKDKVEYARLVKQINELKSKSWFKNRHEEDIGKLEGKKQNLIGTINDTEKANRSMDATIKANEVNLADGGYVKNMADGLLKEKKFGKNVSLDKISKTDLTITNESNVNGVTGMTVDVSNVEVSSVSISNPHFETENKDFIVEGNQAKLDGVVVAFEVIYPKASGSKTKEEPSPLFLIRKVDVTNMVLTGPASVTKDNKSFAKVNEENLIMEGFKLSMNVTEGASSFESLTIKSLSEANIQLPGLMANLSNFSAKEISISHVATAPKEVEGKEKQKGPGWKVGAKDINGKVSYSQTTENANKEKINNNAEVDLSHVKVNGSYYPDSGIAYLEDLSSSENAINNITLETLSWSTTDGKLSIRTLGKPATLTGIDLSKVEVNVDPKNSSVIKKINIKSAKVNQLVTQGLSVTKDDKHVTLSDKESKISGIEVNNLLMTPNKDGDLTIDKSQVKASSVNLAPFVASATNSWNANISNFSSGAISINMLENGGIEYDTKNLDVKGKVSNKDKDGKSKQSSDVNIDSKEIGGSYKSETIGKDYDSHEVITISNKIDIPSIVLSKLNVKSPELELKASANSFDSIKTDFTLTIVKPSTNELKKQTIEYQNYIEQLKALTKRTPQEEEIIKHPKFEPKSHIDLTINSMSINQIKTSDMYAKTNGIGKLIIEKLNEDPKYYGEHHARFETTNEFKSNPGEVIKLNKLKMANFKVDVPSELGKEPRFTGKAEMGDENHKAIEIGNFGFVQNSIEHYFRRYRQSSGEMADFSNFSRKGTDVKASSVNGNIQKISYEGTKDGYVLTVTKPTINLPGDLKVGMADGSSHELGVASRELAAKTGFNLITADLITTNHKNEDKSTEVIFVNPVLAPVKAKGEISDDANSSIENYSVNLKGKIEGNVTISLKDGKFTNISIPDYFELNDIDGDISFKEKNVNDSDNSNGQLNYNKLSEEEAIANYKNNGNYNFLNAANGSVTLSMFGESKTFNLENIDEEQVISKAGNPNLGIPSTQINTGKRNQGTGLLDVRSLLAWIESKLEGSDVNKSGEETSRVSSENNPFYALTNIYAGPDSDGYYAIQTTLGVNLAILVPNYKENVVFTNNGRQLIKLSEMINYLTNKPDHADSKFDKDKFFGETSINSTYEALRGVRALLNNELMNLSISINSEIDMAKLEDENPVKQAEKRGLLNIFDGNEKLKLIASIQLDNTENKKYDPNFENENENDRILERQNKLNNTNPFEINGLKRTMGPKINVPSIHLPKGEFSGIHIGGFDMYNSNFNFASIELKSAKFNCQKIRFKDFEFNNNQ